MLQFRGLSDCLEPSLHFLRNAFGVSDLEDEVHVCLAQTADDTQELASEAGVFGEGQVLLLAIEADTDRALTLLFISVGKVRASIVFLLDKLDEVDHLTGFLHVLRCEHRFGFSFDLLSYVPTIHDDGLLLFRVIILLVSEASSVEKILILPLLEMEGAIQPIFQCDMLACRPVKLFPLLQLDDLDLVFKPLWVRPILSIFNSLLLPHFELNFFRLFEPLLKGSFLANRVIFILPKDELLKRLFILLPDFYLVVLSAFPVVLSLAIFIQSGALLPVDKLLQRDLVGFPDSKGPAATRFEVTKLPSGKFSDIGLVCYPVNKTVLVSLILVLLSLPGLKAYHLLFIFEPLLERVVSPLHPILF